MSADTPLPQPAASAEPGLELSAISLQLGSTPILHDLNLSCPPGSLTAVVGPSGCGKTTLLRIVAGLNTPAAGSISWRGRRIETLPAHQREAAMVWQSPGLFPHLTVRQNVAYGLPNGAEERVDLALDSLDLVHLQDRTPERLSGGQAQRVALARAIVTRPRILLLDEPLANVDMALRAQIRADILTLHRRLEMTTLYVTHDLNEALTSADQIVVMQAGRIIQVGAPPVIYNQPNSTFVAEFSGVANLVVPTRIDERAGTVEILRETVAAGGLPGGEVLVIRPHDLHLTPTREDQIFGSTAAVTRRNFGGSYWEYLLESEAGTLVAWVPATGAQAPPFAAGDFVTVTVTHAWLTRH